eukprot:gnl/TRDRNA2_/TRDRNA2_139505_c0_seq1.p1 gnl/TRDRNA2_/TRDRNA2_139505_c0~~gnl/TRDRNA2_/TRDRNA2_139505_c0_seq1.p1  ORF type:complete len:533 (+),score=94.17 gnl/TRDRNA2_/TRDRNA2_139505_c0_seq1:162-1760(+)
MNPQSPTCTEASPAVENLKRSSSDDGVEERSTSMKKRRSCTGRSEYDSVLKLFVKHTKPKYSQAWCTNLQTASTSSGFPVRLADGSLRVITNAHSVEHATLVQLSKAGCEAKYVAQVVCVGHDCDLALCSVADEAFWEDLHPLTISPGIPKLQSSVSIVGYPTGGQSISVTKGVVSRADLVEYAQGNCELLAVQIDAAINGGNSGGPAFNKQGHCIGVAFQRDDEGENLGYIIPSQILLHFLDDFQKHGTFTGFGSGGFSFQTLESPTLRQALGLKKTDSGVRVKDVDPSGPAHGILKAEDVILRIEGEKVANDGTVALGRSRISFPYLFNKKFEGDSCELQILRPPASEQSSPSLSTDDVSGRMQIYLRVRRVPPLVAVDVPSPPPYYIVGGLVLVPLTEAFLESTFGKDFAEKRPQKLPLELLRLRECPYYGKRAHGREAVVLTKVLASTITVGYTDFTYEIVESFNGIWVQSLQHLRECIEKCEEQYLKFQLVSGHLIVLDRIKAQEELPSILAKSMIPSAASACMGAS